MAPDDIAALRASVDALAREQAETRGEVREVRAILGERCAARGYEIRDLKVGQAGLEERIGSLETSWSLVRGAWAAIVVGAGVVGGLVAVIGKWVFDVARGGGH